MNELEGREFDWYAMDENGAAAVFSTAGSGTVPQSVIDNYEAHDLITEKLETPNWGSELVWDDLANYGLFVFDWELNNGPYIKKSKPKKDITPDLKEKISNIVGIPSLKMAFNEIDEASI